ncbi:hypothetical protein V491_06553, partial [Pseudogymnoascus sp. VKM F-3775]
AESGKSTPVEGAQPKGCEQVLDLDFGACKLQVQVPVNGKYRTPADLIGKNIGTSFVSLAAEYFAKLEAEADAASGEAAEPKPLRTKIIELSGSVEAACALGVADGIVDLVESGETMKAAGLEAIDTVVSTKAILIKSKNPSNKALVDLIASRIQGVISAKQYVLCQYNVERKNLDAVTKVTPGRRAATINALEEEGWVAVSSMVEKKRIATVMDELSSLGAEDILVMGILNTRRRLAQIGIMSASPSSSPPTQQRRTVSSSPQQQESSLSRLVIAPLTFLSFLLSLFLIDTYSTSSRRRDHARHQAGGWLSTLLWRPKAESPYAYVGSPGKGGTEGESEEWVWHTKQRKMLRMEIVDAFELRRWVMAALGVMVVVLGGAGWWVGWWIWGWLQW